MFGYIQAFDPDIVVTTEVGLCELAALFKRESRARYHLVGAPTAADVDRGWAQPEVELYPVAPGYMAARLTAAGVAKSKIVLCGLIVDPAFNSLPDRGTCRARLGIERDVPMVLVLFGGTGAGEPRHIVRTLAQESPALHAVFIAGNNRRLEDELRHRVGGDPRFRVYGWVDNIHEWMGAADLLISKPGAATMTEAIYSGLPLLAVDPLPGNECRACNLIEEWGVGIRVRNPEDLGRTLARLLACPQELQRYRENTQQYTRPGRTAALHAAEAILKLLERRA